MWQIYNWGIEPSSVFLGQMKDHNHVGHMRKARTKWYLADFNKYVIQVKVKIE